MIMALTGCLFKILNLPGLLNADNKGVLSVGILQSHLIGCGFYFINKILKVLLGISYVL